MCQVHPCVLSGKEHSTACFWGDPFAQSFIQTLSYLQTLIGCQAASWAPATGAQKGHGPRPLAWKPSEDTDYDVCFKEKLGSSGREESGNLTLGLMGRAFRE